MTVRMGALWLAVLVGGLLVVGLLAGGLLGCKDDAPSCERICKRLSECKLEAQQGSPILGEGKPPPDTACLEKCASGSDYFKACEGKPQDCEHLLACSGAMR